MSPVVNYLQKLLSTCVRSRRPDKLSPSILYWGKLSVQIKSYHLVSVPWESPIKGEKFNKFGLQFHVYENLNGI